MRRTLLLGLLLILSLAGGATFFLWSTAGPSLELVQETTEPTPRENDPQAVNEARPLPPSSQASAFVDLLPSDCANECADFADAPEKLRYCQNVCGLSPTTDTHTTTETPSYQISIDRKEAAIKNKDLAGCAAISDANLRKSCEVRVTEDLLE